MADEATSVGKIQLDIEISKTSIAREIGDLNKSFGNSFKSTFNGIGSQMNGFMKNTLSKMVGNFKEFSQVGNKSNNEVAQGVTNINSKYEKTQAKISEIRKELEGLSHQQDIIATNYANMPSLSGMNKDQSMDYMLNSDKSYNALGVEIEKLEEKIKSLTPELGQLNKTAEKSSEKFKKVEQGVNKTSKSFKVLGDQSTKSTGKVNNFTAMLMSSFTRILKRIFIFNLIYKAIRGLMNYMNGALKTNKQFASSLQIIGTNLRVAFQPIYDYILPALNALMRGIATVTTYIAGAMSALFGKTYKQSYDSAKGIESAKKAMTGYGSAAKKAGKDAKGALAGFDEINTLDISKDEGDDSSGGSGDFEMSMPEVPAMDFSGFEKFKGMLQPTIDSLKNLGLALEPLKNFIFQGLQDFYNNFLVPVGQWTFGEGLPRFIDAITKGLMAINWQPINDGLNNLWKALSPFAINVGEGLLWLWENVLVPFGTWTMNEIVPRFLDILAEAIKVLNIVIETLKPLGLWLWENFLKPLAEWTGGIIVSVLDGILDALKGLGDWVEDNQEATRIFFGLFLAFKATTFVVEMAKMTAAIIANTIAVAVSKFETLILIGLYVKDAIVKAASTIATIAMTIATVAWNVVVGIATIVTTAFGVAIAFLTSPIGLIVLAIGALIAIGVLLYQNWDELAPWIKETWEGIKEKAVEIWNGIKEFFIETWNSTKESAIEIWDSVKTFFVETWDNIKLKTEEVWNNIKTFLVDKIWNPIKTTASTIFNSIKSTISTIFNSIKTTTSTIWNGITGGLKTSFDTIYNNSVTIFNKMKTFIKGITDSIEGFFKGMVNGVIGALNSMINGLNKLNVDIPDWIPGLGGKSLGFSIPNIPKLARGGIIDQPTLAMVGEQGKEAVVPLENNTVWMDKLASAVVSAMMGVMQLNNSNQSSGDSGDVILQLEGITIARILGPIMDKEKGRIGNPIIQPI